MKSHLRGKAGTPVAHAQSPVSDGADADADIDAHHAPVAVAAGKGTADSAAAPAVPPPRAHGCDGAYYHGNDHWH